MNDENVILNGNENAGPTEETQTPQPNPPGLPADCSRTGKIARLPPGQETQSRIREILGIN
jgi:hypothetical protein